MLLAIAYDNATIVVAHLLAIQVVYLRIIAMCNLNAFYGIGIRIIILDTHGDRVAVELGEIISVLLPLLLGMMVHELEFSALYLVVTRVW